MSEIIKVHGTKYYQVKVDGKSYLVDSWQEAIAILDGYLPPARTKAEIVRSAGPLD